MTEKCPIYCRYCGAKLRRDTVGHYCPTHSCQWQHGVATCTCNKPVRVGGEQGT